MVLRQVVLVAMALLIEAAVVVVRLTQAVLGLCQVATVVQAL
jgi:hypothetical protein